MIMSFYEYINESINNSEVKKLFHNSNNKEKLSKTTLGIICIEKPVINKENYFYIEFTPIKTYITDDNKSLITDLIKLNDEDTLKLESGDYNFFNFKIHNILQSKGYDSIEFLHNKKYIILNSIDIDELKLLKDYNQAKEYYTKIKATKFYKN